MEGEREVKRKEKAKGERKGNVWEKGGKEKWRKWREGGGREREGKEKRRGEGSG